MKPSILKKMKHRIVIQEPIEISDDGGGVTIEWSDIVTLWAHIEPSNNSDSIFFEKQENIQYYNITTRYVSSIKSGYKILFAGKQMIIKNTYSPDELKEILVITTQEITNV